MDFGRTIVMALCALCSTAANAEDPIRVETCDEAMASTFSIVLDRSGRARLEAAADAAFDSSGGDGAVPHPERSPALARGWKRPMAP